MTTPSLPGPPDFWRCTHLGCFISVPQQPHKVGKAQRWGQENRLREAKPLARDLTAKVKVFVGTSPEFAFHIHCLPSPHHQNILHSWALSVYLKLPPSEWVLINVRDGQLWRLWRRADGWAAEVKTHITLKFFVPKPGSVVTLQASSGKELVISGYPTCFWEKVFQNKFWFVFMELPPKMEKPGGESFLLSK